MCSFIYSCADDDVYKDTSYPYKPGPLEVADVVFNPVLPGLDKIPIHTIGKPNYG